MPAFDELQPSGFAGIGFAVTSWSVKGGLRQHPHEYPGSPGGQVEKLGRRLYAIEFSAVFSTNDPTHPGAFPDDLNTLRVLFEKGEMGPIIIPHIGTMIGHAVDWDEQADPARMRDGVRMRISFTEDSEEELSIDELVSTTYSSLDGKLELAIEAIEPLEETEPDLFESLEDAFNTVQGALDQAELLGDQLGAKIAGVASKLDRIDATFSAMGKPENWAAMNAVHDLGFALIQRAEAIAAALGPSRSYVTPTVMSVTEVSFATHGDTSHALDILKANRAVIDDAFAIPADTTLRV